MRVNATRLADRALAIPDLTQIHIQLPNHWWFSGEGLWATRVGEDAYEIQNVAFFAYDLNYLDVVRVQTDGRNARPEITGVLSRSGHRTLRVILPRGVPARAGFALLARLAPFGASLERFDDRYWAIDVRRSGDYERIARQLETWRVHSLLRYETCEARVPGSFDSAPSKVRDHRSRRQ